MFYTYIYKDSNEKFIKMLLSLNDSQINLVESKLLMIKIDEKNRFEIFNLKNKLLTNFNFFSLNLTTLVELDVSNNPNLEFNIKVFKNFYKLKTLSVNDTKVYGSLKYLRNLKNLWNLSIHNTNIKPYFEFLHDETVIIIPKDDDFRDGFFVNDVIKKLRDLTCFCKNNYGYVFEMTLFSRTIDNKEKKSNGSVIFTWYWKMNNYNLFQNSKYLINYNEIWNEMRDNLDVNIDLLIEKNKNIFLLKENILGLNKLNNLNRLFFQVFNKNGPFSLWLYDVNYWEVKEFKHLLDYQQLYYQSLVSIDKNIVIYLFNEEQNLRNFMINKNLNFNEKFLLDISVLNCCRKFSTYNKSNDIFEDFNILKINEINYIEEISENSNIGNNLLCN
ncbi:MAG: hypothetical protein AM1032_000010 [Mycoplasmataceae bacterium]|nr:MAG: hypothetical protein AM1032_000010 [Mycoplasmataceae bacterium]